MSGTGPVSSAAPICLGTDGPAGTAAAASGQTKPGTQSETFAVVDAPSPSLRPWPVGDPILIAGGGIGGLATALALARRGIPSRVLERRPEFGEDGAGIQLGPNATRILETLGVAPLLAPHAGAPSALRLHDGTTGGDIASLPLGDWIASRHGAPYWVAHRRDLHAALLQAARRETLIGVETDAAVAMVALEPDGVSVSLADGSRRWGRALVAADGLWSSLRARLFDAPPPTFAGKRAVRAVVPVDAVPWPWAARETGVWLRPDAHVVHYPVRQGREIAVVGIFNEVEASREWSLVVAPDAVAQRVSAFAPGVRQVFAIPADWRAWALHRLSPLPSWTRGPVALLGDAAHPMLPFLAQGAVMALEDAMTLAAVLARVSVVRDIVPALAQYAGLRQRRAARVQAASVDNGRIYHLDGPLARARDLTLRLVPGSVVMARYDWLYGWRAMA